MYVCVSTGVEVTGQPVGAAPLPPCDSQGLISGLTAGTLPAEPSCRLQRVYSLFEVYATQFKGRWVLIMESK